jgi:hypothetical protein
LSPTALSTIRVDLGASLEQLEWTVNAYVLSFAVLMMTAAARAVQGAGAALIMPLAVALLSSIVAARVAALKAAMASADSGSPYEAAEPRAAA